VTPRQLSYYDFFAGGGMARLGLGPLWRCLFANDNSEKKGRAYRANFPPADEFNPKSVQELTIEDLPGAPVLSWASFPCQDLSLAGARRGLAGDRSGAFWPFWRLTEAMAHEAREVSLLVLENVVGAISSHAGGDFRAILTALADGGYRFGPMVVDGLRFVPQSRPRLFIVAVRDGRETPASLIRALPCDLWHPETLIRAWERLPWEVRERWMWWHLKEPPPLKTSLADIIEDTPSGVAWHTPPETRRLLSMMSERNREKVREAQRLCRLVVGTVYKRTRPDENGEGMQRAEVRFDQISGCLRTPAGGSSRQTILVVHGDEIRSRLLSPREAARLMGVPDSYQLPQPYNEAYHLMGDGLVVPAVAWLERHLLRPLAVANIEASMVAA